MNDYGDNFSVLADDPIILSGRDYNWKLSRASVLNYVQNMVLIVLKNETSPTKGHVFLASVIQHARVHLGVFCCQEG